MLGIDYAERNFAREANCWLQKAVVKRLEEGCNQAVGVWAFSDNRDVLKLGQSALVSIDVVDEWLQLDRRRYCYKLLLLSLGTVDWHVRLYCTTLRDRSLDLRSGCG